MLNFPDSLMIYIHSLVSVFIQQANDKEAAGMYSNEKYTRSRVLLREYLDASAKLSEPKW